MQELQQGLTCCIAGEQKPAKSDRDGSSNQANKHSPGKLQSPGLMGADEISDLPLDHARSHVACLYVILVLIHAIILNDWDSALNTHRAG
jgi:hypothetical protein